MAEIKLRADEAREMATHVKDEGTTVQEQMDGLRDYLGNLADAFTGQSATAFENAFAEWKGSADQMMTSLDSLGEFLNQAANIIEDTDQQIAGQLAGG